MAHFAKINKDNIVENVVVVPDEQEYRGEEYLNELGLEGRWIQTSYNNNIRNHYAGIGMIYDAVNDIFIPKKPYNSWVLSDDFTWVPPISKPEDDNAHVWNEELKQWEVER